MIRSAWASNPDSPITVARQRVPRRGDATNSATGTGMVGCHVNNYSDQVEASSTEYKPFASLFDKQPPIVVFSIHAMSV